MNGDTKALTELQTIAAEALAAFDTCHQISQFSARLSAFDLDDAYRVTAAIRQMRERRGEMPAGRKIGFTNCTAWPEYGPMWGYVYSRTIHNLAEIGDTFSLVGLAEPRIEPEIIFKLALAPAPGMDETALLPCIDWVAHGFRNRAVNLSWMEVFRARRGRGVRPARCPAYRASSFNRSLRRRLEPDALNAPGLSGDCAR